MNMKRVEKPTQRQRPLTRTGTKPTEEFEESNLTTWTKWTLKKIRAKKATHQVETDRTRYPTNLAINNEYLLIQCQTCKFTVVYQNIVKAS